MENESKDAAGADNQMADPFSHNSGAVESEYDGDLGKAIMKLGETRDDVLVVAADLGAGPLTGEFVTKWPNRFVEAGIAEANAMSIAAGLAAEGFKPYVVQMGAFCALKCAEQIRTDMGITQVPVRILSCWNGLAMGFFGASHLALEEIGYIRGIPGVTLLAPSDDRAGHALLGQTVDHPGPVYFRLTEPSVYPVYKNVPDLPVGKFNEVRSGKDMTIIGTGLGAQLACGAADTLAKEGVNARVLDAYSLKPLDEEAIIKAAKETKTILTVEEHYLSVGLGAAVAKTIAFAGVQVRMDAIGLPDEFLAVGVPPQLYEHYGLTIDSVAQKARVLLRVC